MVDYRVVRSDRKTMDIQVTREGEVVVHCNRRMKDKDIRAVVQQKEGWILTHLEKIRAREKGPLLTQRELEELAKQALLDFPPRLRRLAPLVGVEYRRVGIRAQRSLWGSCSGEGNLSLNCMLMLCPPEVRDYVLVHELCHRLEMNHSAAFWSHVERVIPDYKARRQWLKDNGAAILNHLG